MRSAGTPQRAEATTNVTETLIIVAIVAIAVMGVIAVFGDQIQQLFTGKPAAAPTRTAPGAAPSPAPSVK